MKAAAKTVREGTSAPPRAKHKAANRVLTASVAEAKANLSSLLRDVQQGRSEITVLRRGVAVARIVPIAEPAAVTGYGWMRGTAQEHGDIVGPSGEEWDVANED